MNAYASGYFPMADPDEGDRIYWYRPDRRALLPTQDFHLPRRLSKTMRQGVFEVRIDHGFRDVVFACADHDDTWLSHEIIEVFLALHKLGYAHSVGCYQDERLVGGVYGLALGQAFFAESMFHRVRDASKVALGSLLVYLRDSGFTLCDVQFATHHLRQFGMFEVPAAEYDTRLGRALESEVETTDFIGNRHR